MRVFLDANILFSAAKSNGAIRRLLTDLRDAGHTAVVDTYVIDEARRNLALKYPASLPEFETLLSLFDVAPTSTPAGAEQSPLPGLPDKDQPVLAASLRHHCDALLTGDSTHFGPWFGNTISTLTIHSPRTLASALFD